MMKNMLFRTGEIEKLRQVINSIVDKDRLGHGSYKVERSKGEISKIIKKHFRPQLRKEPRPLVCVSEQEVGRFTQNLQALRSFGRTARSLMKVAVEIKELSLKPEDKSAKNLQKEIGFWKDNEKKYIEKEKIVKREKEKFTKSEEDEIKKLVEVIVKSPETALKREDDLIQRDRHISLFEMLQIASRSLLSFCRTQIDAIEALDRGSRQMGPRYRDLTDVVIKFQEKE